MNRAINVTKCKCYIHDRYLMLKFSVKLFIKLKRRENLAGNAEKLQMFYKQQVPLDNFARDMLNLLRVVPG